MLHIVRSLCDIPRMVNSSYAPGQSVEIVTRNHYTQSPWIVCYVATVLKVTAKQVVFSGLGTNPPQRAWIETGKHVGSPDYSIRAIAKPVQAKPTLAQLWRDLKAKNAKVAEETRTALLAGNLPPSRAAGSNYAQALEAYRAFWNNEGAQAYAKTQYCPLYPHS